MNMDIEGLCKKIFSEANEHLETNSLKKLKKHSKKVKEISLELYDKVFPNDDSYKNIVIAGALLHDIKKYDENGNKDDNHHKSGREFLKHEMFCDNFSEHDVELIKDIVRYHKGGTKYIQKYHDIQSIKAIEIVRASDKISKLYKIKKSKIDKSISKWLIYKLFKEKNIQKKSDEITTIEIKRSSKKLFKNLVKDLH